MKKILLLVLSVVSVTFAQQRAARNPDAAVAEITDDPALPRVLLIGDSISKGYLLPTRELLRGKANLHRIPRKGSAGRAIAGSTKDGLVSLDNWLSKGKWDVIHFNWGLHDLKHWKNGRMDLSAPQFSTTDEYEKNLRELVPRLKATGARLIWASTTPVPEGSDGRVKGDEIKYNAVAARVMNELGVPINDLHALCVPKLAEWQLPKNVHFNRAGSRGLAEKVAKEIEAALKK